MIRISIAQEGRRLALEHGREMFRRWRSATLVGPLFYYELVRLARRGRSIGLRCAYVMTLFGTLCLAYAYHFGGSKALQEAFALRTWMSLNDIADFGHSFILAVLLVQSAAAVVITPIYLAGAIAEEKERQTFALLLASHLSDREIVLGKLLARLLHLGSVLLAGLPIVLAASWMGGSGDVVMLLSAFVVTAVTLLSAGSISMFCSVLRRNAMTALMCSYGCLFAFSLICIMPGQGQLSSPVAFVLVLDNRLKDLSLSLAAAPYSPRVMWQGMGAPARPPLLATQAMITESLSMTAAYVLLHGLIAIGCIRLSIRSLRTAEPDPVFHTPAANPRLVPVSTAFDKLDERLPYPARPPREGALLPPPTGDPLVWKEMVHDPVKRLPPVREAVRWMALQVLLVCGAFWLQMVGHWWYLQDEGETLMVIDNALLRVASIAVAFAWCVGVAFRTASSLSRERERRTLSMLLTLPVERAVLLRAKWLGGILRLRSFGILLLGIWSLGLLTGALDPLAVLLLAGCCLASLAFLASLGVWLALACRNTKAAQASMALMLLVLFAVPWLHFLDPSPFSPDPKEIWQHLWQIGLNPFAAWWVAGFSLPEWRKAVAEDMPLFAARLSAVVEGIAILTTLAGIFWLAARHRLDMEPRG